MKRRVLLGFMAFLSVGVALVAPMPWLLGLIDGDHAGLLEHLVGRYTAAKLVFLAHVSGGGLALLVGSWQLMPRLRARHVTLHRVTGYIYVTAVAIGGAAGLAMAPRAWGGPIAQLGFTALAIAWLATTAIGFSRIRAGDRAAHRTWMTRSFALAFAAVSLRLQLPLFGVLGIPALLGYQIVAWSCWVPNLVVTQWLARRSIERAAATSRSSGAGPASVPNI